MKDQREIERDVIKVTRSLGSSVWKITKWVIATASLAVLYYIVFSLLISTPEEKRLSRENKLYAKLYPELVEKEKLIEDVVEELKVKDNSIYERLFHSPAPRMNPINTVPLVFSSDSVPDRDIVNYTYKKGSYLTFAASRVEDNFHKVFDALSAKSSSDRSLSQDASQSSVIPPLSVPLEGLNYARTGATVGRKLNPFYKVMTDHTGIDLIAAQGAPVYATASGVVESVTYNRKGLGNVVTIKHEGGYTTRYAHLADIVVMRGQKVARGKKIGEVGMSGKTLAPHLHYEVRQDTTVLDPVNFFFADITPEEYTNMIYMSVCTGQSLD